MALAKEIATDLGVSAGYARVHSVQLYYADACLDVTVLSYLDKGAREGGKQPMSAYQKRLTFDEVGSTEPTRADIYAALKGLPEWSGAQDA